MRREVLAGPRAHRCAVSDNSTHTIAAEDEAARLIRAHLCKPCEAPADLAAGPVRLHAAGGDVEEDLILLQRPREDADYVITAATALFSFGDVGDKVGRDLAAVHAPVPGYARWLAKPVARLLHGLRPSKGMSRSNWELRRTGCLLHPGLDAPGRRGTLDRGGETAPERLFLRVEYQTLRRLPRTGAILFTVRTVTDPLPALASSPVAARALHDRLVTMDAGVAAYKGLDGEERAAVSAYLATLADRTAAARGADPAREQGLVRE